MGKLYIVATPIGNLSDISARALDVLGSADIIAAEDTRRTLKLLTHFGIKSQVVSYHKFNERERGRELVGKIMCDNINVAVVSDAGTPCISDPGAVIVGLAHELGVTVEPVPGPSAAVSALSASGFEIDSFMFLGFFPRERKKLEALIAELKQQHCRVFVFYESPKRVQETFCTLAAEIPDFNAFIINDITKLHEKYYRGTVAEVYGMLKLNNNTELGEYTVVIRKTDAEADKETEEKALSAEAAVVEAAVKNKISVKEAVKLLTRTSQFSRNELYAAALSLKALICEESKK